MDDLISRKAVLDIAFKYCPDDDGVCSEAGSDLRNMLDEIENLPPAEPKTGKWVDDGDPLMLTCENCGYAVMRYNNTPFCPNCGADMRTAEQIVHDAIDNTPMAEDAYPGIKERLHKAVDDMREVTNGN